MRRGGRVVGKGAATYWGGFATDGSHEGRADGGAEVCAERERVEGTPHGRGVQRDIGEGRQSRRSIYPRGQCVLRRGGWKAKQTRPPRGDGRKEGEWANVATSRGCARLGRGQGVVVGAAGGGLLRQAHHPRWAVAQHRSPGVWGASPTSTQGDVSCSEASMKGSPPTGVRAVPLHPASDTPLGARLSPVPTQFVYHLPPRGTRYRWGGGRPLPLQNLQRVPRCLPIWRA